MFLFSICLVGRSSVGDKAKWASGGWSAAWPGLDHSPVLCPWASHFTFLDLILLNYKWRPDLDHSNSRCSIPFDKATDVILFSDWLGLERDQGLQVLTVLGRRKYIARIPQKPEMVSWVRTSYFLRPVETSWGQQIEGVELTWGARSLEVNQSAKETALTGISWGFPYFLINGAKMHWQQRCEFYLKWEKWNHSCNDHPGCVQTHLRETQPCEGTRAGCMGVISQPRRQRPWKHEWLVGGCLAWVVVIGHGSRVWAWSPALHLPSSSGLGERPTYEVSKRPIPAARSGKRWKLKVKIQCSCS